MRSVDLPEALNLLDAEVRFIDVRSVEEYTEGHIPGAFNVPFELARGDRLEDNPEFVSLIANVVAPAERALLYCHSGSRSERAARAMERAGYRELLHLEVGWDGRRDPFGQLTPGWRRNGLPQTTQSLPGRDYAALVG